MANIGKLTEVDVRELWKHEQYDFSNWLAKEENLEYLNDIIGLTLADVDKEVYVGPYRCDIVAKDETSGITVIVENQLEGTNHDHLGKIITYAVEARQNNLTFHNMNNVYFFNMLEMILDKGTSRNETKEKVIKYAREHSIDKTVIMTVAGATNCKIDYNALAEKGDIDMCTLFEETRIEGEAKGIVEIGYDFGLSENDILERLQNKLKVSLQTAQGYLEMFGKQTV